MSSGSLGLGTAIALFLVITQLQMGSSSAGPDSYGTRAWPQQPTALLTIRGSNSMKINGARVISGATVPSGVSIESPNQVGGTLKLGSLGTLDIAPNTICTLEFNENGNVKVILTRGCVILNARKDTAGEIDTSQGVAGKTDPKTGGTLHVCFPQPARAEVRAEVPEFDGGLFDLGKAAAIAIIGGRINAGVDVAVSGRGSNPGPSTPNSQHTEPE